MLNQNQHCQDIIPKNKRRNSSLSSYYPDILSLLLEILEIQKYTEDISVLMPCPKCLQKSEKMKSFSYIRPFATLWTVIYQALPSMEFSRQEYWSRLSFPSQGDLSNPGIEPGSPTLQTLYHLSHQGSPSVFICYLFWFLSGQNILIPKNKVYMPICHFKI